MNLLRLHLSGFGYFADLSLPAGDGERIHPNLTVIHGPNEAGKSTLLTFVRYVLFGFPARERDRRYPPRAGGRHGGRIELEDDDGRRYVVERFAGRKGGALIVTAADGGREDPAILPRLLGHASPDLFNNVFAFDLDQLRNVTSLQQAGVTDSIYSAGLGSAGLPQVMAHFESARREVYRPQGKTQPVARTIADLQAVDEALDELADAASQYGGHLDQLEQVQSALVETDRGRARAEKARARLERLHQAWPDWVALGELEERIHAIAERPDFPSDPLTRLESAEQRLAAAGTRKEQEQAEFARWEREVAALHIDQGLLDDEAAVDALRRSHDAFAQSLKDLPERRAEAETLEREIQLALRALGPEWEPERADRFDTSLPVRTELREQAQALAASERDAREAELRREAALQALREAEEARDLAAAAVAAIPAPLLDAEALRGRRAVLTAVREQLTRVASARDLRRQETQRLTELQVQQPALKPAPAWRRPEWITAAALAAAVALVVIVGVLAGGVALALGIVGGVLLAAAGGLIWRRAAQSAPDPSAWREFDRTLAVQGERRRDADEAVKEQETRLATLGAEAALDAVESIRDVEAAEEIVEGMQRQFEERRQREAEVRTAARRLPALRRRQEEADHRLADAARSQENAQTAWTAWLEAQGLPATMRPDGVADLFGRLDTLHATQRQLHDRRRRAAAIEHDIDEFATAALSLLERRCPERQRLAPAEIGPAVEALIAAFDESRTAAQRKAHLDQQVTEARRRLTAATADCAAAERALQGLLTQGRAEDAAEFRKIAAEQAHRAKLLRRANELRMALTQRSGPGEALAAFRRELAATDAARLERERERTKTHLVEQARRHDDLTTRQAQLQLQIANLEQDARAAELRERRVVLQEQLAEQAQEWVTLTLAGALLEQARHRYEEDRQPAVVHRAEDYFAHITNGRYPQLKAPIEEHEIEVMQRDGERKPTDALSRGTQEQLYLALRFGLIEEFADRSARLPVIVDDILVNFDPERATRAAEALRQLSRSNQVIVFTCHPRIVDLFNEVSPGVATIPLPDWR